MIGTRRAVIDSARAAVLRHDGEAKEVDLVQAERTYGMDDLVAAWDVRLLPGQDDRHVDVLVRRDYPFVPPSVGIAGLGRRPHVGVYENDILCLDAPYAPLLVDADAVIAEVLDRAAQRLAKENADEALASHRREFASYWSRATNEKNALTSILAESHASRVVAYARLGSDTYVGEDPESLARWLANLTGRKRCTIGSTALVAVSNTPNSTPPATNAELLAYCLKHGDADAADMLRSVATTTSAPIPVVIHIENPEASAFVGAWLDDPRASRRDRAGRSTKRDGFRKDHDNAAVLADRFFSDAEIVRARVRRADAAWLFSRGGDGSPSTLLSKRVTIIGAGSVGAAIARRLAKAGVGKMDIIDAESLTWDNVARHELGGRYVGYAKATAMARTLTADFPHMVVADHAHRWEDEWATTPSMISEADIVVCTIAEAASELHLNFLARTERFPPVVFGWLEDRAAAAHALLVGDVGGCLACALGADGVFALRAVEHRENPLRRIQGCDAFFQPYTALEAESGVGTITEAVLRALRDGGSERSTLTTWIAATDALAAEGGALRPAWIEANGDPGAGRRAYVRPWSTSPDCPVCDR